MRTMLLCGAVCVGLVGCRLPPDREPFKPLPEDGARFSYGELLARLHSQANAAMDAFFVDAWIELDEAATGLDQTARFLAKTNDPPEHLKTNLVLSCGNLQKEATRLAEAARNKNVDLATQSLQRITLQIRQLRARQE
jgi:hypothetical protein